MESKRTLDPCAIHELSTVVIRAKHAAHRSVLHAIGLVGIDTPSLSLQILSTALSTLHVNTKDRSVLTVARGDLAVPAWMNRSKALRSSCITRPRSECAGAKAIEAFKMFSSGIGRSGLLKISAEHRSKVIVGMRS